MSQSAVGTVYGKVIEAVCEQSQVDFEEGGIDQGTLELLKTGWQKKLSEFKVTQLPWDPPPPTPATATSTSSSSNPLKQPAPSLPSNGNALPIPSNASAPPKSSDGPRIKQEPGAYPNTVPQPNGYSVGPIPSFPPSNVMTAQQRAAMNLQQRYGHQAANQITQLQQQSGQQRAQNLVGSSYSKAEDQKLPLASVPPFASPVPSAKSPVDVGQTDGADDSLALWKFEVANRRHFATQNPGEGDRLLYRQVLDSQRRLEAGGLMLPLDERYAQSRSIKGKFRPRETAGTSRSYRDTDSSIVGQNALSIARAQGDATGDDDADEEDGDAINSDLDDPDQQDDADNDEENTDQMMLCTYDKVQRVKNKWKCTLKDGIVRVGGTDYVFHKGQGEFEW